MCKADIGFINYKRYLQSDTTMDENCYDIMILGLEKKFCALINNLFSWKVPIKD